MKKLFTMITVCAATLAMYTASAGTPSYGTRKAVATKTLTHDNSGFKDQRASVTTCDTLFNLNLATADSNASVFLWQAPSVGYVSGNGALGDTAGGTLHTFPITAIAEEFFLPSSGFKVNQALVEAGVLVINHTHGDSILPVTAYVYDTTGTGAFGTIAPGHALDSATVTLGSYAAQGLGFYSFTNQPALSGKSYFIVIKLPLVTGDTLALATNNGTTGHGHGWLDAAGAGWAPNDSLGGALGNYILSNACKTTTGISSINAGVADFNLFPNPSNGVFTAALNMESASDVTISVMDVTGNKIYESTELAVKMINKQINLSSAAAGLYFVNVKTATGSVNQRIVIK